MSVFRRRQNTHPAPRSYQERLRAIGRQLDRDKLRFQLLMETPDGFVLKAEELATRNLGNSGSSWSPQVYWLNDSDIQIIVDDAHDERNNGS